MRNYLIAIDGGGTKTLGLLKNISTGESWSKKVGGSSLTTDFKLACKIIISLAKELSEQSGIEPKEITLVCGVAGAGNENKRKILEYKLKREYKNVLVVNDGVTSLYGAGKGKPIIVAALGTGSVVTRLDNNGNAKQFGGWGFPASDGGSGAFIGRLLVKEALFEFDKIAGSSTAEAIFHDCFKLIGDTKQSILDWLNTANPSDYATIAPLVFIHRKKNPVAQLIFDKAVTEVVRLIELAQSNPNKRLPVAIIGGLAEPLFGGLKEKTKSQIVMPEGNSIDGALYLAAKMVKSDKIIEN